MMITMIAQQFAWKTLTEKLELRPRATISNNHNLDFDPKHLSRASPSRRPHHKSTFVAVISTSASKMILRWFPALSLLMLRLCNCSDARCQDASTWKISKRKKTENGKHHPPSTDCNAGQFKTSRVKSPTTASKSCMPWYRDALKEVEDVWAKTQKRDTFLRPGEIISWKMWKQLGSFRSFSAAFWNTQSDFFLESFWCWCPCSGEPPRTNWTFFSTFFPTMSRCPVLSSWCWWLYWLSMWWLQGWSSGWRKWWSERLLYMAHHSSWRKKGDIKTEVWRKYEKNIIRSPTPQICNKKYCMP